MKTKILVIDDEQGIRDLLTVELEQLGYEVITAKNGEEGIGKIRQEKFVLVITDIRMPGMDGVSLLKEIKRTQHETEVIMMTGYGSMETAIQSLRAGAFDFVNKPFNIDDVVGAVKKAVDKYHLKRAESFLKDVIYVVIVIDAQEHIRKVNKATESFLSYEENELTGFSIQNIFSEKFPKTSWNNLKKENKVKDFPIVFLTKDKLEIQLLFTGTIVKDNNGQVTGLIGTGKRK